MTDILYIVGKNLSEWKNNELRYSLRSIARNGLGVGNVYIAGWCPAFVDQDVVHYLPVRDIYGVKHYNIMRCIEKAVETFPLSEKFLYSSDDHFYIAPTMFDQYPAYWRGVNLPDHVEDGDKYRDYHETLVSTYKLLSCCGLPVRHMAWHGNTWFNRRLFLSERFALMRRFSYQMQNGCEPSCLMLNYWQAVEPSTMPRIVVRNDCKLRGGNTREEFERKTTGREVCSCTDNIARSYLAEYLQHTFDKKCIYEL